MIYSEIKKKEDACVVKIGAHNGLTDPLFEHYQKPGWHGLLIEPVPHLYYQLRMNMNNSRFKLLPVAVFDRCGTKEFYYLNSISDMLDLPEWASQLGSFNRGHITKHFSGEQLELVDSLIMSMSIGVITLGMALSLIRSDIDMLVIDCEGSDYDILYSYEFLVKPKSIVFETKHMTFSQYTRVCDYLKLKGYKQTLINRQDTLFNLS